MKAMDKTHSTGINEKLIEITEELKNSMWPYHARLGKEYKNTYEQLEDAANMGRIAQVVKLIYEARAILQNVKNYSDIMA